MIGALVIVVLVVVAVILVGLIGGAEAVGDLLVSLVEALFTPDP